MPTATAPTTSTQATLVPPPGLVTTNPTAGTPTPFCLFTEDWLTLQALITQALTLPITVGDFTAKYGPFSAEANVEGCVAAMQSVQGLSTKFGNPQTFMQELANNPAILQTDTAPAELYTHIIWFATRLSEAATTVQQNYAQFISMLDPGSPFTPEQAAKIIKDALTGAGGVQSTAQAMTGSANALVQSFAAFTELLGPSVTTMTNYTSSRSTFLAAVKADISTDMTAVTNYQTAAASANKKWENLTISAVTTSVGVLVLTGGLLWPVSAVLGGSLGAEAAKAKTAYNSAIASVATAEAAEQQKILLKLDLEGLNTQMLPVAKAAQDFLTMLEKVEGIWLTISNNIAHIATTFTVEQLADACFWNQVLAVGRAEADWQTIASSASQFTENSLVSAQIVNFGDSLPS